MSLLQNQFLFTTILLLLISLSQAVPLDGACDNDGQCDGTNVMICRDRRCQCNAPWYKPCNTGCERQTNPFYEGEQCFQDDHCLDNARCDTRTRRCTCRDNYSSSYGLCYKTNNETCVSNEDCWSRQCNNTVGRCSCRLGYEPTNNGRCRRRLVRSYDNWAAANDNNAFCSDDFSCQDVTSVCRTDFLHGERFCQCPTVGYRLNEQLQKCEPIEINQLAPFYGPPTPDNSNCTFCRTENAVCVLVGRERTCWCRAGFDKAGDECRSIRSVLIFPNLADRTNHSFDSACELNTSIQNSGERLCTCAKFHEFDPVTRLCRKIERKWINEDFEYGLCTRIAVNDEAEAPNSALCPEPLQCRSTRDKNICSCGENRTLEAYLNTSRCVYRLGKDVDCPKGIECPGNSTCFDRFCRCREGFKEVDDGRRCELILSRDETLNDCDGNRTSIRNDTCNEYYGGAAFFCRSGECRCNPLKSFSTANNSHCYGLFEEQQTGPVLCPPNSESGADRVNFCRCRIGYINSTDRRSCELKLPLYELDSASNNYPSRPRECDAYQGPLANVDLTAGICRCERHFYRSPNGTQCWPLLYTNLTQPPGIGYWTPNATCELAPMQSKCKCNPGYRPTSSEKKDCERIRVQLYRTIVLPSSDIDRIDDGDCRYLFGILSVTNNSQCICPESIAFSSDDGYRCLALLDINTGSPTLGNDSCPRYASLRPQPPRVCQCNPGFLRSQNNRTCLTISYPLNGTKMQNSSNLCSNYTNDHCRAKYGEGAFCEKDQCWCDRRVSFKVNDNQCEILSKYVFPDQRERSNFTCDTNEDCTRNGADIKTVECKQLTLNDYKLCVCRDGWLLNPRTQLCETRCPFNCANRPNTECQGYDCVCKTGYIEQNGACVSNPNTIELYKTCNYSSVARPNDPYQCSSCRRGDCISNYQDTGFRCVRYTFDNARCVSKENSNFCNDLFEHSECDRDENRCVCSSGYYQEGERCVRPYNFKCREQAECGSNANCIDRRCQCYSGRRLLDARDSFGRTVQRCSTGGEQLRLSCIFLFFVLVVRLFFV